MKVLGVALPIFALLLLVGMVIQIALPANPINTLVSKVV